MSIKPDADRLHAILLAAGVGQRLTSHGGRPKVLLEFGGRTLLARHLDILARSGVKRLTVVTGYEQGQIEAALEDTPVAMDIDTRFNPDFHDGSLVSLACATPVLESGADILLMDADVLYDYRMLLPLLSPVPGITVLYDRDFAPGEEPVKLCLLEGRPVEFSKRPDPAVSLDAVGESVGFFRVGADAAPELAARCRAWIDAGHNAAPHEDVLRDMLLAAPAGHARGIDVTGLPWTEIDFPEDVERAAREILPQLQDVFPNEPANQ